MWKQEEPVYIFNIAFSYSVAGLWNIIMGSIVLIEIKIYPKIFQII